ncbi:DNA primase [hydrothermal vent metagenome]|uniref:DNA primase n=1 Tax=hydrothermal vent metagenome TaxID=652676 RepID=A0A3B0Z022_9ZZZZ
MLRTNIVDLIDDFVPLRRNGSNHSACCPFHDEKTPSFTVSDSKQFYHCFGCGAHGTAVGFLMEYERMSFPEAIHELASRANLTVPSEASTENNPKSINLTPLYDLLEQTNEFYQQQLRNHQKADAAINYLKDRGVSGSIAKKFNIGYAPEGWNNLIQHAGNNNANLLIDAGLSIKKDENNHCYDRFRNRIMFPIRDARGRVIGFGGRVLGDDKPKYLNSPETSVFHKGKELYGLFEARKANNQPDKLLVVEGYMDVVALAQYEIQYAVATLGTSATPQHMELLYRHTPEVVFCFDGDKAGIAAAWRALRQTLPTMKSGRQARFLFLPDGEDPDTLIRKEGKTAFEQRISTADSLSTYLFTHLSQDIDLSTLDGRARLAEFAQPLIKEIPKGYFKDLLIQELTARTQVDSNTLNRNTHNEEHTTHHYENPYPVQKTHQIQLTPMRKAIMLLIQNPQLAQHSLDNAWLSELDNTGAKILLKLFETLHTRPHLHTGAILELWPNDKERQHLSQLACKNILTPEAGLKEEFLGLLKLLQTKQQQEKNQALFHNLTPESGAKLSEMNDEERKDFMKTLAN